MSCSQCHLKFHLKCFCSNDSGVICSSCLFNNNTQDGADHRRQEGAHPYDIPDLNTVVSKKGLKILHQNIRGLLAVGILVFIGWGVVGGCIQVYMYM